MNPKWLILAPFPVWIAWGAYTAANPGESSAVFPLFWALSDLGIVLAFIGVILWLYRKADETPPPARAPAEPRVKEH